MKASTLISSLWETWRNLVTSVAAQQWATLYYETVSLSGFRVEMPGNGYFKKESSTWREVLIYAELRRARRLTSRREESTGCTEGANDLSKKNLNRVNELKPHLKKKTPSYESWSASSAHSLVFWRKSYVPRGVNGAMFAVNKSLKGFKGLRHEGENTLSKSRFWLPWLGFGCGLWRLSTPLLMVSPQRKTNLSIVKCVSGLTQSDYKWLWSRC